MNFLEATNKKKEINGIIYLEDCKVNAEVFIGPNQNIEFQEYFNRLPLRITWYKINDFNSIQFCSNDEYSLYCVIRDYDSYGCAWKKI